MHRKITAFLALIFVSMFSLIAISEAQDMDKNQPLNAKQQSIVPIAAFTANGDLQRLKTALNEGLDAGLTINEIKEIPDPGIIFIGKIDPGVEAFNVAGSVKVMVELIK